jgi:hypothetical protein
MKVLLLVLKQIFVAEIIEAKQKCLSHLETTTLPPLPEFVTNEIVENFDTWKVDNTKLNDRNEILARTRNRNRRQPNRRAREADQFCFNCHQSERAQREI